MAANRSMSCRHLREAKPALLQAAGEPIAVAVELVRVRGRPAVGDVEMLRLGLAAFRHPSASCTSPAHRCRASAVARSRPTSIVFGAAALRCRRGGKLEPWDTGRSWTRVAGRKMIEVGRVA